MSAPDEPCLASLTPENDCWRTYHSFERMKSMNQKQGNLINKKKIAWQQIVFWSISLILSVATFFFVRRLTACWQLTALPGIPPSYCGAESDDPTGLPAPDLAGMP